MKSKGKEVRNKKLEDWLRGMSLQEKVKTLESGKLLICEHCGFTVFDKEKPEDRIRRKCTSSSKEHSFAEEDDYIILKRGFTGIIDVVSYSFGAPKEAVIDYFKRKR
ncbi:MAG: hypothetical protein P9M07_02190 [Candidatus Aceula meridiana]|nr:hypothetical protein [Candidatus Aceula meridiana]